MKTLGKADVAQWALRHRAAASIVVSDGLNCFTAVQAVGAKHEPAVVGTASKSSAMPCFRWVNTVLSNLKTATGGTCHAFDFDKYGFLYLAEAQYRFNRRFDLSTILTRLLYAAAATGNRTEAWCRLAEDQLITKKIEVPRGVVWRAEAIDRTLEVKYPLAITLGGMSC